MSLDHLPQRSTLKKTTIVNMLTLLVLAACSPTTDEPSVLPTQDKSSAEPVSTETVARPTETATPIMQPDETEVTPSVEPTTIEVVTVVEPTETALPSPEPTAVQVPTMAEPTEIAPPTEAAPRLHPPDARTGSPPLDAVIEAVLAHAITARRELTRLTVVGCTHADGLGGPPKCQEDEAEGTPLEVLPILGSEGHHTRAEDLDRALSFQVEGLYAVYEFSDDVYDSVDYPAGEVGLLFLQSGPPFPLTVHVTNGAIVRLDYDIGDTLDSVFGHDAAGIILPPPD